MASTTGRVQQIVWAGSTVCMTVGASATSAEPFFVRFRLADTAAVLAFKKAVVTVFVKADAAGYPVSVEHAPGGAEVLAVALAGFDISPVGLPVHGDFYSVTGSAIPPDAELVFETTTMVVTVTPDLVRPHWVFVAELPSAVPVGRNLLRLEGAGWRTDSVPVDVVPGPPAAVRVLYPGAPKPAPYAVVLTADPGIVNESGQFRLDPLMTNRPAFHDTVAFCLRNLLTTAEDCLRQGDGDRQMRFVVIFDSALPADDAHCLVQETTPNVMQTRKPNVGPFLARYGAVADVALVIHGSTTHTRAWTWASVDDAAQPSTAYTYDGVGRVHGHVPQTPGSAALSIDMDRTKVTPLHECLHAVADFNNGRIVDLYVDPMSGNFMVNKKSRPQGTPVPPAFATYNALNAASDPTRDGLGYPAGWMSYHPALLDPARPNVMDNYLLADDAQRCRLDVLTHRFLTDRLAAKLTR